MGAYVIGQRSENLGQDDRGARRKNEMLHRLIGEKTKSQAYTKLGFQAEYQKHFDVAVSNFQNALIVQNTADGHYNLGNALLQQSKQPAAVEQFKAALALDPKLRDAYTSWGQALMDQERRGRRRAGVPPGEGAQSPADYSLFSFQTGAGAGGPEKNPEKPLTNAPRPRGWDWTTPISGCNSGPSKTRKANSPKARNQFEQGCGDAGRFCPRVQFQLAVAQQNQGKLADAITHYEAALAQTPDEPDTLNNLALIYATAKSADIRNPKMAVSMATKASTSGRRQRTRRFMDTLARSYAADGDFLQAALWEKKAMERAGQSGDKDLQGALTTRYALFQQHKPE